MSRSLRNLRAAAIAAVTMCLVARGAFAQGGSGVDLGSLWKPTPVAPVKAKVDSTAKASKAADSSAKTVKTVKVADSASKTAKAADTVSKAVKPVAAPSVKPDSTVAVKPVAPAADASTATLIAALRARVDSLKAAQDAAAKQAAATEKATAAKLAGLGNFRFNGDVRVRYEGQFQSGGFVTRHRERSRARLGISGNLTDELTGAIAFATGALDDVQSSNQTQTGFFARKTIGFDKFFLSWKPSSVKGLAVVAGKFPYAWDRTALTFGNDINPEGVAPSYSIATTGTLQSITLVGYALPFLEVSGGQDSYVLGGQVQTKWQISPKATARVSYATADFHGVDAIAQAVSAGSIKPASANTNRLRTDSTGKVLGYTSGFSYGDVIAAVEYTPRPRLPMSVLVDVVSNNKAAAGEGAGLWTEVRVGRLSQLKDVQAAWTFMRIERDAVLGAFNEQDLRAATNVMNHRLTVAYQWRSNATLNIGAWYGKLIDPSATGKLAVPAFKTACTTAPFTGCKDPWLTRIQLDLSYRF